MIMTPKRYLWVFLLTVLGDFVASCYGYLIAHVQIIAQMFLGFSLPFINFLSIKYFIEKVLLLRRKVLVY